MKNRRLKMELLRDGEIIQSSFVLSSKHKAIVLKRWRHMYGKKYDLLTINEFMFPKYTDKQLKHMEKQNKVDSTATLRKLITEGFKEYDGDIREMALEALQEMETHNKIVSDQFNTQAHDVDNLTKECQQLKDKIWQLETELGRASNKIIELEDDALIDFNTIDFGIGKMHYRINKGGVITLTELMQALEDAALVVPLPVLIKAIKNVTGSPRF